jgi:tetratricopeptide (TPR) repeat protein
MNRKTRRASQKIESTNAQPDIKVKLFEFANLLFANSLFREAEVIFRGLLHALPNDYDSTFNLAHSLCLQGKLVDSIKLYEGLLQQRPGDIRGWSNLGSTLLNNNQVEEAVAACRKALALDPGYTAAHVNLSNCLLRLRQPEEGAAHARLAIQQQPDNPLAYQVLGGNLSLLQRFAEAIEAFQNSLTLNPNQSFVLYGLGFALRNLGRLDEAQSALLKAIEFSPNLAIAHYCLGQLYLLRGQFDEGWREYEWRWNLEEYRWLRDGHGDFSQPRWQGEPLAGKTILVYAEQGFGDTLQFVRFIPRLKQMGARVVLAVQPALVKLCQGLKGVTVMGLHEQFPPFDYHSPLLSLPRIFGTNQTNIPAPVQFIEPDPERVAHWREILGHHGFRVGIIWQGRPGTATDLGRSPPLAEFAPVAAIPGVRLISLQLTNGLSQLESLPGSMAVETLGENFDKGSDAFQDTIAIFSSLDLVISSDTAIAHLAGTFGMNVLMPTAFIPDWRWNLQDDTTPWYPTMRLYRQSRPGDWESVFARMAADLAPSITGRLSNRTVAPGGVRAVVS